MAKKLISLVLAVLLAVFALFSLVTAFFSTMEWIRVHIDLISALFNGTLNKTFNNMFLYYGGARLNSPWLSSVVNFLSYNINVILEYVVALIALAGACLIAFSALSSSKKKNVDKKIESLTKKLDKLQIISEESNEEKTE